jgi:hypothetical protein
MVFIAIIFSVAVIGCLALFMQKYHDDNSDGLTEHTLKALQIGIYCLYGLIGMYLLCILCMWKNIQRSIAVMQTAAVVVTSNLRIWLIPLLSSVVVCGYLVGWLAMFCTLLSCAEVTANANSQLKDISFTGKDELVWMLIVQGVALLWMACLLMDIFNYTLIVGVCNWYFTSTSDRRGYVSLCSGFCWAITTNLGTLAMGSGVITVAMIFRILIGWLTKRIAESSGDNCIVKCIACAC